MLSFTLRLIVVHDRYNSTLGRESSTYNLLDLYMHSSNVKKVSSEFSKTINKVFYI